MTASEPKPDWTDPDVPLGAGIDWADPNGPLVRLYLSASQLAAVVALGLMTLLVSLLPLAPSDIWGHLAYGRWIAENRALPASEPLNPYTDRSAAMFHPDWAAKVGYHLLFEFGRQLGGGQLAGGVEAVCAGHAAAVGLTLLLLLFAYRRAGGSMPLAVAALGVVFVLSFALLGVQRPQGLGAVCFAGVLAAVIGETPHRRSWLIVPAAFAVWANVHGSWPAGLMLLALLVVGRAVDVRSLRDPVLKQRVILFTLAVIAVMANPYGPGLYAKVAAFSGHPNLQMVGEWQPLDPDSQRGAGIIYAMVLGIVLAAFAVGSRPPTASELLLVLVFAAWTLFQQRGMFWWLLVAPTVILPHLATRVRALNPSTPSLRKTLFAAVVLVLFGLLSPLGQWARGGGPRAFDKCTGAGTPIDAAELWAKTPGAIFSDETTGEFLQWAAPAGHGPMLFAHAHVFPARHWAECVAAVQGDPGWPELLDRYRVNLVVVASQTKMADQLREHPDWSVSVAGAGRPLVAVRAAGGKR